MNFRYWAFLSYSHADESFARRLHLSLERYTLPRRLRKAHALPARLIPVFRDVEELEAAHGLTERLQHALDQSRWLVVLCSPASAKSKYVNAEIEYFIGKHGAKRVLCALVEGEPADAFPPAIKALSDEPLAADFRPGRDFELGRLKLIAAMALVGFTELRNREAQRKRRQRTAVAAFVAGLLIGAIGYWDLCHRIHVDSYVNYARRNGIWQGIDRVSADLASRRAATYRFTRRGRLNPPDRVDYVNGSGTCAGDGMEGVLGERLGFDLVVPANRYCATAFEYSRDGRIQSESLLNQLGKVKQTLSYTTTDLAQLTQEGFAMSSEASGVNYVQFSHDAAGFDASVRFLYARGVPRANRDHDYGFVFTRDPAGRVLTRESLDDQGKGTGEIIRLTYGPGGNLVELRHEDRAGLPRVSAAGYASQRYELDDYGRVVRETFLTPDGKPTFAANRIASRSLAYDLRGNVAEICYFDDAGQPAPVGNGNAECERMRYDDLAQLLWRGYFDHTGAFKGNGPDVQAEFVYDAVGNLVETRNLGADGELVEETYGVATTKFTHDGRGNIISEYFYGADGNPAHTNYGFEIRHTLNLRDQYTEFSFYDAEGKPFMRPEKGYAQFHNKRDDRGNIVERAFLGADLKPIVNRFNGSAFSTSVYDEYGSHVEQRMLGTERQLLKDINHVAIYRREYNTLGHMTLETYFDEAERPTLHREGYYGLRVVYDHRGRESQRSYLDATRKPMVVARLGGAGIRYDYDAFGRVRAETYLDEAGNPLTAGAVQRVEYMRDKYGEELARRYFGPGHALAAAPASGCTVESRGFDALGHLVSEQCLDEQDRLRDRRDDGWAQKLTTYDHGRIADVRYVDARGNPVEPPR